MKLRISRKEARCDEQNLMTHLNRVSNLDLNAIHEALNHDMDWKYIYQTSCILGVAPLFYYHLKKLRPPALENSPLIDAFRKEYHLNLANNLYLTHEFDTIVGKLAELGIPCIGLKGVILSRALYPSPALRPMYDIDILVKKEDLRGVCEALNGFGYEPENKKLPHEVPKYQYSIHYKKKSAVPVFLDLHWALGQKNRYRIDDSKIWDRAKKSPSGPYLEMSDDDTLLYLSLHFFKHFLFKRLSWLCDIHEWIKQREIHWDRVVELAQSQSIATFLIYTLVILEDFYQAPLSVRAEEILRIGWFRTQILNWYLHTYPMFQPLTKENYLLQRIFAFSCIDRMSDRMKFTLDALRRDLG